MKNQFNLLYIKQIIISQVDRSTGSSTTSVTIIGTKEAQKQAKILIEESLKDVPIEQKEIKPIFPIEQKQEDEPNIDFRNFDWKAASKECVS